MSLFDFVRLIYRNIKWLVAIPLVMAVLIFLFTGNQPKTYASSAMIYTGLASGYNIESDPSGKTDYRAINAAYDNLMSIVEARYTLEEVGMRLLALNLTQQGPGRVMGKKAFAELEEVIPQDKRDFVDMESADQTYENIRVLYNEGHPLINKLVRGKSAYGIEKLRSISVRRVKSSDMIKLSYTSYDPGLCENTLSILLDVFTRKYRQLKESETGDVVAYFENQLAKAKANLTNAEQELTEFRVESQVINYGEETKALAIKKQNALEEFAQRKMDLKATETALKQLEERMSASRAHLKTHLSLLKAKEALGNVTTRLARARSEGKSDSVLLALVKEQAETKTKVESQLQANVQSATTVEGIPVRKIVLDWMENVIQFHKDKVSLEMFEKRLQDINDQYDNFTPMGSTIDRLERQISVYEREYLEVLHGLNMSRLRQQNIEMTSNLEIIDDPAFPLEPEPSKRLLLVIAGAMFGLVATLSVIIAVNLLDQTLRHPEKASKETGLEPAGALPVMSDEFMEKHGNLIPRFTGFISAKIKLERFLSEETGQELIILFSINRAEGKTTVTRLMFEEFCESGEKTLLISPFESIAEPRENIVGYAPNREFNGVESIHQLAPDKDLRQYKYILLEIPPLNEGQIPIHIIEKANVSLLIARADKAWNNTQKFMVSNYTKLSGSKPFLILNGVKMHYLDHLIGEIPRKNTRLKNWIKSMLRFELAQPSFKTAKS